MASPIETSKRKAEENIENGDERQFIKQEGLDEYIENVNQNFDNQNSKKLDEQNCTNSSEQPEVEFDEKSWIRIMSDNDDESHVSEPRHGGMFLNQVGTSLCGGYNLPPALNEVGLMYQPIYSGSFEQEEPKNTQISQDPNNEEIDEENVPLQVSFSKKSLKSARRIAGRPKTKNEKDKCLSKDSKDEPKDERSELEIDEEEIPSKKLRTSRKTQPKQKSGQTKAKQNNPEFNSKFFEESPQFPGDPTGMEAEEETSDKKEDDLEQPRQVHQIFFRFSLGFWKLE